MAQFDRIDTIANPSAAPVAGGATTPGSRFGGTRLEARLWRFAARLGRRMTGMAYRNLRRLEGHDHDDRHGAAGMPSRTAGAPAPHERHPHLGDEAHHPHPTPGVH